jgi:adenylate kinase
MIDEIHGIRIGGVLSLRVATPELVNRLRKRAAVENRTDDTDATVQNRLRVYEQQTAPVIDFYRKAGLLNEVEGEGEIEDVQSRILTVVEKAAKKSARSATAAATNGAEKSVPRGRA